MLLIRKILGSHPEKEMVSLKNEKKIDLVYQEHDTLNEQTQYILSHRTLIVNSIGLSYLTPHHGNQSLERTPQVYLCE